ncbi:MAG TPA: Hsp20/alpha crystallin family protein [Candidatus Saccharimonadales bacterium]|nr:Hsp20/alpha crystallin family protein [Candidatus Saccharimonadales bacterium]
MQLIRYNPIRDLLGAEKELDKFFSDGWPVLSMFSEDSAVDMYTEDGKLVAEIVLPNFSKEEVKVTACDDCLEITAEHHEKEEEDGKRTYLLRESSRSYRRRISLPAGADADDVNASFKDGKLVVTMPFEDEKESKEVTIT